MKELWIDQDGIHRANLPEAEAVIGWFLEQDVQSSQKACLEYISELDKVRRGEVAVWEATGNAFTVVANKAEVTIESEFSDHSLPTSTARLIECLIAWSDHIKSHP